MGKGSSDKEEVVCTAFIQKKLIQCPEPVLQQSSANMHLGLTNSLHTRHCLAQRE